MKVVDLTEPQQTQAAAHKTAVDKAAAALNAAQKAQTDYLRTVASAKNTDRVTLAEDGACIVVG